MASPEAVHLAPRLGCARWAPIACLAGLVTVPGLGQAQTAAAPAGARAGWFVEPSISLRQTVTSNVRLEREGMADAITEITPALRLQSRAGRWQGSLDYALTGLLYARNSRDNTLRNALSAQGRGELVDRWLFIDAAAQVSRESGNALAPSGIDDALLGDDLNETASLQISPSVRGSFGGWADYTGRLSLNATRTKDSPADSYGNSAQFQLAAPGSSQRRLGWSLDLSHQASRFIGGSRTESDSIIGALLYGLGPEWRFTLRGGREFNDVQSVKREGFDTWGLGVRWRPSPRSSFELNADDRYFGRSHSLRAEHRMARTVFSYTDSRDVSGDAGVGGGGGGGTPRTVNDLLFDMLASSVSEPIARAVTDAYLQSNGLTRTSLASGGFLTTSVSLQRRQQLAVAYNGLRGTLLLSAHRGEASALNAAQSILPGLPPGVGSRQWGWSLSLSHRLSAQSSLTLQASQEHTEATNTLIANASSNRTVLASWNLQLPQRAYLSVTARRSLFDRTADAYNESALVANLTKRF